MTNDLFYMIGSFVSSATASLVAIDGTRKIMKKIRIKSSKKLQSKSFTTKTSENVNSK